MLVKVGDPIQLNLQLEDGASNKHPRAILRNQLGSLLPESPVNLTHTGDGLYQSDSVFMPDTQEVTATYKVYDDVGRTLLSQLYSIELDVFTRDSSASLIQSLLGQNLKGDIDGYLDDSGGLQAFLDDTGGIMGDIDDSGQLEGYIEEFELTGIVIDGGELRGELHGC